MTFQELHKIRASMGTQIPVEDAQPGDLIFYAKAGHVYHVVMYAGDGKTIEAANTKAGINQWHCQYGKCSVGNPYIRG